MPTSSRLPREIEHRYGETVHVLNDPLALALLNKLCAPTTIQPEVNRLVGELYRGLLHEVVANEFPRQTTTAQTRMHAVTPAGVWSGECTRTDTAAVVVAVARAGLLPSQIAYDFLNQLLVPQAVRQDHLALARTVDAQGGVTGADLYASKIGGSVEGRVVLIPDPMGATGSTVSKVLQQYGADYGKPAKVVALHLIITPEYVRHVRARHPDVLVYALRLDRGLSAPDVLHTMPGTRWDEERGLTDEHYIVPGGGGLGEIINNSFV